MKPSVLYVLKEHPQISQTYIKAEIEAVRDDYDITVVSRKPADIEYAHHHPYRVASDPADIRSIVDEVQPDIIHTHYLDQLHVVGPIAEATDTPFTIRAHSYDTVALRPLGVVGRAKQRRSIGMEWHIRRAGRVPRPRWRHTPLGQSYPFRAGLEWLRHPLCLGVLAFPYARPWLVDAGVPEDTITDCFPLVVVRRFEDHGPNGDAVMNTGVATPKKQMEDFLELARRVPERQFNLYAMGYHVDELAAAKARTGSPAEIVPTIQPEDMPAEYKKHQWLVYTADFDLATVGWPMAVAEAQASGVGVCMPRIRPDLADYVGDGGYLYDSIDEITDLIRGPVPEEMREAGFRQARRSDVEETKHLLTDLWERVAVPAAQS